MLFIKEIIGYSAAVVGTLIMVPQVYRTLKTKRAEDVSMVMLGFYIVNCVLWEWYGIMLGSVPMILCNIIGGLIVVTQLWLKLKYRPKK